MANTIRIKRSAVENKVPNTGDLQLGELAINTFDGKLYTKKDNGTVTIVEIGAREGQISNIDIAEDAAIVDTKLATISTVGKVSNSATTAASANTANAIVARDASGNFSAGTITAALTGNAATATKLNSVRNFALTGDVTGTVSSDLTSGASIAVAIAAGVIVNADVNASAAIAGTKISPNFGSQNVITTGTNTAASLIPTGSSVPTNGLYLPAANTVAIATNSAEHFRVTPAGDVGVGVANPGYKLEVAGSFAATTKSFVIPHPTRKGYKLRYGSLEGPENGIYVRGRSKKFIIELPEYWAKLVDADSITVSLTPIGKAQTLWIKDIRDNKVYVGSKCTSVEYFYMVFAERADVDKLEVEVEVRE
jgi:hypothetical protein